MAKAQNKSQKPESRKVKVIRLYQAEGAYGFMVHEVDEDALGEPIEKTEPDIWAIFNNQLSALTRHLFGFYDR